MQKSTNNLKALRKSKGFNSIESLSDATGVPLSSIGAFEKGTRPLNSDHQSKIEAALGEKIVEISTPDRIEDPCDMRYATALQPWKSATIEQLESLLKECVEDRDYGAVTKVADELLNRKIQEKLK